MDYPTPTCYSNYQNYTKLIGNITDPHCQTTPPKTSTGMLCCNWIHYLVTGIQHSSRNTPPKTNHKLNYCKQEEIRRGNYCLQALLLASPNLTTSIINLVNRRCYSNYSILQDATVTISTGVIECVARCYSNQMLQVDTPRYYKQVHPTRREFRQESVPHTLFIQAS